MFLQELIYRKLSKIFVSRGCDPAGILLLWEGLLLGLHVTSGSVLGLLFPVLCLEGASCVAEMSEKQSENKLAKSQWELELLGNLELVLPVKLEPQSRICCCSERFMDDLSGVIQDHLDVQPSSLGSCHSPNTWKSHSPGEDAVLSEGAARSQSQHW